MPESNVSTNTVLEVEAKYRVSDFEAVRSALVRLGAKEHATRDERDTYLAHPVRNFAETDEAFRVRTVGTSHCLTYKGPRTGGPMKTREEIEVAVGSTADDRPAILRMMRALGFRPVADVEKRRTPFHLYQHGQTITITLDELSGLPPHVEVEVVSADRHAAEALVDEIANQLGLSHDEIERRSYLELALRLS